MITSFHHVGCLVASIETAIADYKLLHPGGAVSEVFDIEEQQVKVCFFTIGATNIEFVEPVDPESALSRMLKKNPGFYHIGIHTNDIDGEIARLEGKGYRVLNKFRSGAFGNRYCAFLYNNELHLIELIEEEHYY